MQSVRTKLLSIGIWHIISNEFECQLRDSPPLIKVVKSLSRVCLSIVSSGSKYFVECKHHFIVHCFFSLIVYHCIIAILIIELSRVCLSIVSAGSKYFVDCKHNFIVDCFFQFNCLSLHHRKLSRFFQNIVFSGSKYFVKC